MRATRNEATYLPSVNTGVAGRGPDRHLASRATGLSTPYYAPTMPGRRGSHCPAHGLGVAQSTFNLLFRMPCPRHVDTIQRTTAHWPRCRPVERPWRRASATTIVADRALPDPRLRRRAPPPAPCRPRVPARRLPGRHRRGRGVEGRTEDRDRRPERRQSAEALDAGDDRTDDLRGAQRIDEARDTILQSAWRIWLDARGRIRRTAARLRWSQPRSGADPDSPTHNPRGSRSPGSSHRRR